MLITYSAQSKKALRKMPPITAGRIVEALEKVAENPSRPDADVRKLQGRDGYRLRVGDWRAIFTADGVVLTVVRVAPRGDAYK